jgi:hypothetical protein
LVACFTNAIPFYGYTVAGDLVFAAVMFGVFEASRALFPVPRHSQMLSAVGLRKAI